MKWRVLIFLEDEWSELLNWNAGYLQRADLGSFSVRTCVLKKVPFTLRPCAVPAGFFFYTFLELLATL